MKLPFNAFINFKGEFNTVKHSAIPNDTNAWLLVLDGWLDGCLITNVVKCSAV